jgi:hypothetical protein
MDPVFGELVGYGFRKHEDRIRGFGVQEKAGCSGTWPIALNTARKRKTGHSGQNDKLI